MITGSELGADASEHIEVPEDPYYEDDDDKRLWIGNLDPRMTEFAILKLVQKFGSIRKMDCIYHKAGPDKGKSKGYCFVSFHTWEAAEKARKALDGKLISSRPMYVKWARGSKQLSSKVPNKQKPAEVSTSQTLPPVAAAVLSLSESLAVADTETKIEAIEAKLRLMEQNDCDLSLHSVLAPIPGLKPVKTNSSLAKTDSHSYRKLPYRRPNTTTHRHKWKK
ncbi:RNA-binding protein 18 [Biomphalaria glabrata]|uniref:Probable RNA-binding protein 18 n=1 Tax=Biomphalaria glabrata TaxID=6526 RepID=A0A2C9JMJ4_BIOGL|nr:probable RNA-binding protein 18 [Biomphalaria glabrata]XP_055896176.1 probable RNA-binding protein 18 [Biomphalaria glabrata]KAI8748260.1 putative RNA-binding protein 18 [Biomphalaria glabrata]KAI8779170.1 RNA-binding protein 18 [Biomphalaria glabrata]